jgi:hypothetical protein
MAIEELLRVVAPPERPLETGDAAQWAEVERLLGTRLPRDLYDLATRYGSGMFVGPLSLNILNPFARSYLDQLHGSGRFLRDQRGLPARYGTPYGVFPDRPGWLLWGHTTNGDDICLVTEGEPEAWPLLLISDHCRNFQQVQMPLTTFLARVFTGSVQAFFAIRGGLTGGQPVRFIPCRRPETAAAAGGPAAASVGGEEAGRFRCPWEGEWLPPDELGRPTGARVVLGPGRREHRWNGFAAEGFTVYPGWWHELPQPRRWRRGQLLGWRLGGPAGAALHNLIPLTERAQRSLWAEERVIAGEVSYGARMICAVRATYEGANRYPSAVRFQSEYVPGFSAGGSGVTDRSIHNT